MTWSTLSVRAAELRGIAARRIGARGADVRAWMAAGLVVSLTAAAIVLAVFGTGESGLTLALRITARWCFVLFWPAYAGGALARLGGPRFHGVARRGREFGLAFAAALLVHVGLVLWIIAVAADQRTRMLFFWAGVICTYALALLSLPRLHAALGTRLWRLLCTIALEYIALVFAVDFIVLPLHGKSVDHYPVTYLPFAVALIAGTLLRVAAFVHRHAAARHSVPAH